MTMHRGVGVGAAALIAGVALVFPLAGISGAPAGHPWKSSVPFTETVFDSSTAEAVTLTGTEALTLHVTGNVITGWTVSLKATLHHTTGLGAMSGGKYRAKGTIALTNTIPPGPPGRPTTFQASFNLFPPRASCPGGCARSIVFVPDTITLNADGSVGSVQVGHSN
jgi:hypothetical protein